jgi:UDP-glucose 4-epimerase
VRAAAESASQIELVPYEDVYPGGVQEEMFHREPSIAKIEAAIGWRPTVDLDGIIADVIAHMAGERAGAAPGR